MTGDLVTSESFVAALFCDVASLGDVGRLSDGTRGFRETVTYSF